MSLFSKLSAAMPASTAKSCATCGKSCYPTEKVMISDLWVHKTGCLKCSVCFTTLSLSSVYVAASPVPPGVKQLYCSRDVPKIMHTSIVDSLALRAALNAPNPTTVPGGVFEPKKMMGSTKSIRFKGLTLRSRAIKAGLEAPKLNLRGLMKSQAFIGNAPGSPLDSWDIVHAMSVQSQVSSPIRDHPAIHAQRTGNSAAAAPMPSQPLVPDDPGIDEEEMAKAGKDEEPTTIEPDLVKNLIKVFQLSTVDKVEITPPPDAAFNDVFTHNATFGSIKPATVRQYEGTIKTLATIGSRVGTQYGTDRDSTARPALMELFQNPAGPPPTPAKPGKPVELLQALEEGRKAMALLEALLPLAAHLIPLPETDDMDLDGNDAHAGAPGADEENSDSSESEIARNDLVRSMAEGDLELVILFEEEPQLAEIDDITQ